MQFVTIVLFIDMPNQKFLTINIKMDIMHSHLWTLLCSKDDASWIIKDATIAIQYLMPNGRMYRSVDVPENVAALVRKAAEQLHINTEVYAKSFSENQIKDDPFWESIEKRIDLLAQNIKNHHDLLLYLLALLYVDLPPRRNKEFQTMIIDSRGTEKEYSMNNTFDGQWFCFRSFKSVMRDKHQYFPIDKLTSRLRNALELYLQIQKMNTRILFVTKMELDIQKSIVLRGYYKKLWERIVKNCGVNGLQNLHDAMR